jgi:hypothetical protein
MSLSDVVWSILAVIGVLLLIFVIAFVVAGITTGHIGAVIGGSAASIALLGLGLWITRDRKD